MNYPTKTRVIEILKELKEEAYTDYRIDHSQSAHEMHCALQMAIDTINSQMRNGN